MKYRIDAAVKPAGDGHGFDITNGHSEPIVSHWNNDARAVEGKISRISGGLKRRQTGCR